MELTKPVLDCMQALRRRLREELGEDIHLSQSDVISALLEACNRSDSIQTHRLGEQLAELCGIGQDQEAARMRPLYRGQVPNPQGSEAPPPAADERQVRIYRGQRVYV
jgi:hypothetical protein